LRGFDMPNILVTGGTGTLGKLVVSRLQKAGFKIRVMSRKNHEAGNNIEYVTGDLATGEGADVAVKGVEIIMHLAGSSKGDEVKTKNLVEAAKKAGVQHLIYISVVGADRPAYAYFESKLKSEQVIESSGIPWTTLRATQFHDLVLTVARAIGKLPVIPIPSVFRFQPIDTDEVAARLVELARGEPAGLVPDMAGPKVETMAGLVREYLQASHKRRLILPIPMPGKSGKLLKKGVNLNPGRAVGHRTWEEFLAERIGVSGEKK
jgi:uncharacterized protein YbjT (DUF2867 family)